MKTINLLTDVASELGEMERLTKSLREKLQKVNDMMQNKTCVRYNALKSKVPCLIFSEIWSGLLCL
jgi:hypothetical protein